MELVGLLVLLQNEVGAVEAEIPFQHEKLAWFGQLAQASLLQLGK